MEPRRFCSHGQQATLKNVAFRACPSFPSPEMEESSHRIDSNHNLTVAPCKNTYIPWRALRDNYQIILHLSKNMVSQCPYCEKSWSQYCSCPTFSFKVMQTSRYDAQETEKDKKHEKDIHRCKLALRDSLTSSLNNEVHQYITKHNILKLDIYTSFHIFRVLPGIYA